MRQSQLTRIKDNVEGRPRYICHFSCLINKSEKTKNIYDQKVLALQKAKKIGGKQYKDYFMDEIAFISYDPKQLVKDINKLKKSTL